MTTALTQGSHDLSVDSGSKRLEHSHEYEI
jgi:hypothetical protein